MKNLFLVLGAFLTMLMANEAYAQKPTKQLIVSQYYTGGQDSLYSFINKTIKYPILAKKNRIQGEVILHIKFDENGNVTAATVLKAIGGTCADEALRVAKLIKFNSPGWAIDADLPIYFVLPK
jgi:protein TonB